MAWMFGCKCETPLSYSFSLGSGVELCNQLCPLLTLSLTLSTLSLSLSLARALSLLQIVSLVDTVSHFVDTVFLVDTVSQVHHTAGDGNEPPRTNNQR